MVLARRKCGDEAVNKLYHEFGTAKHEEKKDLNEDNGQGLCIEKAGFSPSLLDEALADDSTTRSTWPSTTRSTSRAPSGWPRW